MARSFDTQLCDSHDDPLVTCRGSQHSSCGRQLIALGDMAPRVQCEHSTGVLSRSLPKILRFSRSDHSVHTFGLKPVGISDDLSGVDVPVLTLGSLANSFHEGLKSRLIAVRADVASVFSVVQCFSPWLIYSLRPLQVRQLTSDSRYCGSHN